MEDLDRWLCSCASLSRAPPLSLSLLSTVCYWSVPLWQLLHYCSQPLLLHPSIHNKARGGESVCVLHVWEESSPLLLQSSMQLFLSVSELALQVPGSLDDNSPLFPAKSSFLLVQTPTQSAYTRWRLVLVHLEQPGQRYETVALESTEEQWSINKLKKESKESKITQTTLEEPEKDPTQHGKTRKRELLVWRRVHLSGLDQV